VLGVGITGHIHLRQTTTELVRRALFDHLRKWSVPVHGISCLAPGPDQTFVEVIRELGGTYDVILPAGDYRERVIRRCGRRHFDRLVAGAHEVMTADLDHDHPAAYSLANTRLIERCQELIAVWDGRADGRPGSTAHAVSLARRAGIPVIPIWPAGAQRMNRPSGQIAVGSATA